MKRHLKGSSEELWRIIQEGFHPYDRHNMTPREYRDNSINSHALVVIGNGLKPEQENLVRKCETAKECWDLLEKTLMGSASIRSSKFDKVQDQADNFVRNEGESSEEVHRRLVALANDMRTMVARTPMMIGSKESSSRLCFSIRSISPKSFAKDRISGS